MVTGEVGGCGNIGFTFLSPFKAGLFGIYLALSVCITLPLLRPQVKNFRLTCPERNVVSVW